jgi:hypothetical protein
MPEVFKRRSGQGFGKNICHLVFGINPKNCVVTMGDMGMEVVIL